ncbi:hypothetical protein C5688_18065 [Methylocystis sp. MitZ-2018]|nr:hypothetical protein C5688_18065 [Methylocystis sp. MitZ-2018]
MPKGFLAVNFATIVADRRSADAMTDTTTQLAILSDALVKIIELGPMAAEGQAAPTDLLIRAGDIAAQALTAAATYGQLPPFSESGDVQEDAHPQS